MIAAADTRRESRGVHTRRDFPEADPAWTRPITFHRPAPVDEEAVPVPVPA
jgi:L-aspartate oxidase